MVVRMGRVDPSPSITKLPSGVVLLGVEEWVTCFARLR